MIDRYLIRHVTRQRDGTSGSPRPRDHLLLGVDDATVGSLPAGAVPEGAKGLDGTLIGWLLVQFGTPDGLRAVLTAVRVWTSRTGRAVEASIDGDPLKVTGVTSQQQEKIIDAWLARHRPGG